MSEYEQNIDFNDVFNYFNLNQVEYSQILSIHSEYFAYSSQNKHDFQSQLECKKQLPTSDKFNNRPSIKELSVIPQLSLKRYELQYDCEVKNRNDVVRQGLKDDTVELNINFKTIICNHFKELLLANQLTPQQQHCFTLFGRRSPSFKSLLLFCEVNELNSGINKICQKFVESSVIIKRIFESKCRMVTKINMIKFVEVLRLNLRGEGKVIKWKQTFKK